MLGMNCCSFLPCILSPIMKVLFQLTKRGGLLHTLIHSSFSICCDFKTFHLEIDHLKTISMKKKKKIPWNFINSCVKAFRDKFYTPKVMAQIVPKRNIFVKLPLLRSTLLQVCKNFKNYLLIN